MFRPQPGALRDQRRIHTLPSHSLECLEWSHHGSHQDAVWLSPSVFSRPMKQKIRALSGCAETNDR